MIERARSEFIVRLEDLVCSGDPARSIAEIRAVLEDDTPDCERPVVWSKTADRLPTDVAGRRAARASG
jgi:hypothetical protein